MALPVAAEEAARFPGKLVWADLVTDDALAAQRFFQAWLGWEFRAHGDVSLILKDGRMLGGIRQRPRPEGATVRPRWVSYVSVRDVNGMSQRIITTGGKQLVPDQSDAVIGDFAVLADPEGAMFGVIRRDGGDPEDYLAEPGEWIWMQLFTNDIDAAAKFYRNVGGYAVIAAEEDGSGRQILVRDNFARASMVEIPPEHQDIAAAWLPFVRVTDIDSAVRSVEALGGSVLIAPAANLVEGKVAIVADPAGAALGLLEWHPESDNTEVEP
jgi:predicted enzyme related to lactoylglutathione lyase